MSIDMRRSHRDRKQTDFFQFEGGKTNSNEVDDDGYDNESREEGPKRKEKKIAKVVEDNSMDNDDVGKIERVKQPKKVTKKNNIKMTASTNNIIFGKSNLNFIILNKTFIKLLFIFIDTVKRGEKVSNVIDRWVIDFRENRVAALAEIVNFTLMVN